MSKMFKASLLVFASLMLSSESVHADAFLYTISDTGTGTLNGVAFTGSFQINALSYTNNFGSYNGNNYVITDRATVTVNGVTAVVTNSVAVAASGYSGGEVGFANSDANAASNPTGQDNVIGETNSFFATYDLKSETTQQGYAFVNNNSGDAYLSTTLGRFQLSSVDSPSTFTAQAVPEPTSLAMLGAGLVGGIVMMGRRRKAKAAVSA